MTKALFAAIALIGSISAVLAEDPIRVLIIDGRNNHDWRNTTAALASALRSKGIFSVDISTSPAGFPQAMPPKPKSNDAKAQADFTVALKNWKDEEAVYNKEHSGDWNSWRPKFSDYAVVVNDYNGPEWPAPVKDAFVQFVRNGGGVVNVHAANNAFSNWPEFNAMLGIGWRSANFGDRIAVNDSTGQAIVVDPGNEKAADKGLGSGHGAKHPFVIKTRDPVHPIFAGIPLEWLHGRDELYHRMRGSMEHLHVLASAYSDVQQGGTGMHEPIIWWVPFEKGRVVTTSLGHLWLGETQHDALLCVGFQTILARSTEWAATGKVTLPVPSNFPTKENIRLETPGE